jgi:hypothetical protein
MTLDQRQERGRRRADLARVLFAIALLAGITAIMDAPRAGGGAPVPVAANPR